MTRTRKLFAILAPLAVAGGLVAVTSTATRADDSDDEDDAYVEAQQQKAAKIARKQFKEARKQARQQIKQAR